MKALFISLLTLLLMLEISAQKIELPSFYVSKVNKASEGYYFFSPIKLDASGAVGFPTDLILDKNGKVIYFKQYTEGRFSGGLRLQTNGMLSYYSNEKFYLMDSTFKTVDTITCKNGLKQDAHEFIVLENGNYLLIGYETIEMDLSRFNFFDKSSSPGSTHAKVKCDVVQELDKNKNVVFEWHGKQYYDFGDIDPYYLTSTDVVDWMHFNALAHDNDGNILISVKNYNEITKINRKTGEVIWRFGGKKNQFKLLNDSVFFRGQHDIRILKNGNITLFDNGYNLPPIHPEGAKEYKLNEAKLEATLVWKHINNPEIHSSGYGNVQRLPNSNTLINYGRNDGSEIIFNVVTANGDVIFEIASKDTLKNYRAYNYTKLPFILKKPKIKIYSENDLCYLYSESDYNQYFWSTGQNEKKIQIEKNGLYSLFVPFGDGGYISSEEIYIDVDLLKRK